jgi:hypothetical protein
MAPHAAPTDAVTTALTSLRAEVEVLSEAETLDALRACEDQKARLAARQAELTRRLAHLVTTRHAAAGVPTAQRGRDLPALVGHARRESPARGRRHLGLARALDELPHAAAALAAGVLSEWRAELIARETACLTPDLRAIVDAELCAPDPQEGSYRFEGWGDRRLVAQTQKIVARLDPAALVNRRSRAEGDRHVTLRPAPDTMARLSVLLPAAPGVAAYAALTHEADAARAAGDPRSRGQIMADTLVERITGQTAADAVPVTVNLVVSDQTLFAGDTEPAWLTGYGPVLADHARHLSARAVADAHAALRRLYATPATGTLVAMDSVARAFPKNLALFLDLRDQSCRTPYCDAPIRHHDHIAAYADGSATSAENGQGLCEYCNHAKQAPGWQTRPLGRSPDQPHEVETTLPAGHTARSRAPAAPLPGHHRSASHLEWGLTDLLVEWAA